jgi:crotonobetainyl-CoA:carnitine CoA-transferase CaiB-like acyl-CoA transferase
MDEDGMAEDWLKEINWEEMSAFSTSISILGDITEAFGRFFETKTKKELLDEAIKWGIMMAPVNTVADVYEDPQLEARQFWDAVTVEEGHNPVKFPGAPVKMSGTPWKLKGGAPRIGAHNRDIYHTVLGFSDEEIKKFEQLKVI